jgi:hypothetical protein
MVPSAPDSGLILYHIFAHASSSTTYEITNNDPFAAIAAGQGNGRDR